MMCDMEDNFKRWDSFRYVRTGSDLEAYFKGREYTHTKYYHYTRLGVIESILKNHEIWLASVKGFNDKKDSKQFEKTSGYYYSLCFSTGTSENLPMWYLYSGVDGKGARLELTSTRVKELITGAGTKFFLYRVGQNHNSGMSQVGDAIAELKPLKDMDLEFRDVLYYKHESGDTCRLKYNTITLNHEMPFSEFQKYSKEHIGFQKGLIWFYEKETRLLVHLKEEFVHEYDLQESKNYVVVLRFPADFKKHFHLTLAPNITEDNREESLKALPNVLDLIFKSSRVKLSEYNGTIDMGLCSRCGKHTKEEDGGSAKDR